jgi:hypothetical protein
MEALQGLKISGGNDLLSFKDNKGNNFTNIALKGQKKSAYFDKNQFVQILNTYGFD